MKRRSVIFGAAALVLASAAGFFTYGNSSSKLPPMGMLNAQSASDIDTSQVLEMSMGAPDAPVTVVEYASFTCPHCASFHVGPGAKLKTEYVDTGKVRFVYRDVYFDRYGLWASMVARCDPNRFFGITDMLYRQQKDWVAGGEPTKIAENLRKIGLAAGLEEAQLDACFTDAEKAQTLVAWYQQNAEADAIEGTPTLLIDGEKYSNMAWDELKAIIDKRLEN